MVSSPPPPGSAVPPATAPAVIAPAVIAPAVIAPAVIAPAARRCEALSKAHRLATWVGEGKPVTPKHVLRPRDVPAAAEAVGILVPARINTAANVRALHRPWKVALAIDFLRIVDGQAVAGPALSQWPDTDDTIVGELWLAGLAAGFAADSGKEDKAGANAFTRIILNALSAEPSSSVTDFWERARESLTFEESYAADPFFNVYRYHYGDPFTALPDVLVKFGAATRSGVRLEVTPLGSWAARELQTRMPKSITTDLSADELIARLVHTDEKDAWRAVQPWLVGRNPLQAAREILAAAAAATPAQRVAAVEIVDALADSALDAWDEVMTVPNLAAYVRLLRTDRSPPRAPSPQDTAWLAVDHAMAALASSGPDEALSCLNEWIDGRNLDSRLQTLQLGNHPDTAVLAEALTAFIASGAKPTSSQVYQLKISLKRMRKPIWRRVLIPATARLGMLHEVIQIVMNWGGDHLRAFFVGDERYGDPFYGSDLRDEEDLRLSDAFTPSSRTITYLYDFGASWYHDITWEKVLDLDVDATYPVCVTGAGDFPIEYFTDEDDDQQALPFDKEKVNSRLAEMSSDAVSSDAVSSDAVSSDAVSSDAVSSDAGSGDASAGNLWIAER